MSSIFEDKLDYNLHYLELCDKYNVDPINMNLLLDQSHDMGIHEMTIKWTLSNQSKKLSSNDKINIMKKKVKILSDLINDQTKLDKLYLSQCYFAFSSKGFSMIAKVLSKNNVIQELYLKNNHLKKENIEDIVEIIASNKTISKLNLEENLFGSDIENMKKIAKALTKNKTLKELSLNHNQITSQEAIEFIKFLKLNKTIKTIELKYNKLGDSFAKYLLKYLPHQSLRAIDLFGNDIDSNILKIIEQKLRMINDIDEKKYLKNKEIRGNDKKNISKKELDKISESAIRNSSKKISTYDDKSTISDNSLDINFNIDSSRDTDSSLESNNNNNYKNNYDNYNFNISDSENYIMSSKENEKKINQMRKKDNSKKTIKNQYFDYSNVDLSKSESVDEFIKYLSSNDNISIDDLLSFNFNSNNKTKSITNDKIFNNEYNFNRGYNNNNYLYSENVYNNNFVKNTANDKTNKYNNCYSDYYYDNKEKYNEFNSKKNSFYENLKGININNCDYENNNEYNQDNEMQYSNEKIKNNTKCNNNNNDINNEIDNNYNINNNFNLNKSNLNDNDSRNIRNNNNYDNIDYNEKIMSQNNINNEYYDSKSNSTSNSNLKSLNNNIYMKSTFESRNIKEEDISESSSLNSNTSIPNRILSPELIIQIEQIMKENEYLKSIITYHEQNGYFNPEDVVLLNKEHENNQRMIENLKHKLIIVSKENEKMNEEMMFMRKRENIILKQFEDKLYYLDIKYAKKFEDTENKLENKYINNIEKYSNNISELEKEKILLCKTLKIMQNKLKSLKIKTDNEKECLKKQMKNNVVWISNLINF
ncbi:hypothetical protein LY90DRAFT_669872 [Neocallimastix californiae]|uniref:RNI-like protein n=1 Tax=Neocallimastix californiae TaxID=1754190 RepID=A0A1Y2D5M9_9FUNG|nr:hypothetical protein LY90DRAFT_669872 [Neocallimastix californiae]|eukprot:ORY54608.1 hypothetical protein LY90DRAFT_669872 [Neocallimastix californiae]